MDRTTSEPSADLRHELRTPINHILGYSELLIEEAAERHLEPFVPIFQQIHEAGRQMLESVQTVLAPEMEIAQEADLQILKTNLRRAAKDTLVATTFLSEDLESGNRRTLGDLNAITLALGRLLAFAGGEGTELLKRPSRQGLGIHSKPDETLLIPSKQPAVGKILIADDDAGNRTLLRRSLESEGHSVLEATNGLEVLALLNEVACDLVLLDIMMPAMDGFQTLAAMKAAPHLRELPVIMISALDEIRSVVRCIEMGAEDYLPKPFNRVLLRARLGVSLDKKWLRDSERRKADELGKALDLLERAQAQLELQASQDALTRLANRRAVDSYLEVRSKQEVPFSIIYIDLNGFKKINDTYGHQSGDELLKQVGDRLRQIFRANDVVGRWGGDEFVALVDGGLTNAQSYVRRITEVLSEAFILSSGAAERRVTVGAAVGVATWLPGDNVIDVLHRADEEMYEQKSRRRSVAADPRPQV